MLQAVGSWKPREGTRGGRVGPAASAAGASQESSGVSTRTLSVPQRGEGKWELGMGGQQEGCFLERFSY